MASSKQTVSGRRPLNSRAKVQLPISRVQNMSWVQKSNRRQKDRNHQNCLGNVSYHFIVFFFYFIFIIAMEKYNLIQTSSILWILFKQAKMVSDLFPNQVQRGNKNWNASPAARSLYIEGFQLRPVYFPLNYFHLALAPRRIPPRLFDFYFVGI